jgi:hypothetical protein
VNVQQSDPVESARITDGRVFKLLDRFQREQQAGEAFVRALQV